MKRTCIAVALCWACGAVTGCAPKLTYQDLVRRVTDLESLAVAPLPGETCSQWSSYDRASKYDAKTDQYIDWGANGDGDGSSAARATSIVMAEMQGPGCIWRIWSAAPRKGHVRIYLDGATEPAVDLPFEGYFDGKNEPFTRPTLVHNAASGQNNYIPIPYASPARSSPTRTGGSTTTSLTRTFPRGTQVPTFNRHLTKDEAAALDLADRQAAVAGDDPLRAAQGPGGR